MAETSDQIVKEIEIGRERLAAKIDELELYVREKTDVRAHFERKPWAFLGGAVLSGLMLSMMLLGGGRKRQ